MMIVFLCLYELVFILGVPLYFVACRLRKKCSWYSLKEKLAIYPDAGASSSPAIWIQVVSVGEAFAVRRFVLELSRRSRYRIVISTTTLTGFSVAKRLYSSLGEVIFFPFDEVFIIRRVLARINPVVFVAVETEMWPVLFYLLDKRKVPIIILNGRISDKAFRRYKKVRFITKRMLSLCRYIGVQDEFYYNRFLNLGAPAGKTLILGNMKFSSIVVSEEERKKITAKYGKVLKKRGEFLFVAASTHRPEEKMILDIYTHLNKTFPLRIVVAPRHPERAQEVMQWARERGVEAVALSRLSDYEKPQERSVFILDTVGELFYIFEIADICFVGGSIADYGGHNILEPLYFLKPTLFGPFMHNFRAVVRFVLDKEAALQVKDSGDLEVKLRELLSDSSLRKHLMENSRRVFVEADAYLAKNLEVVMKCLK